MLARVDRAALLAAVAAVKVAVGKQDVTGCVLVEAFPGRLRLRTTDYAAAAEAEIDADVVGVGAAFAEFDAFAKAAAAMPAAAVEVQADPNGCTLRAGRSTWRAAVRPADAAPSREHVAGGAFVLPAATLARVLAVHGAATAFDSARPFTSTVNVTIKAADGRTQLRAVATDGSRLHIAAAWCDDEAPTHTLPIPATVAAELCAGLAGVAGNVTLAIDSARLSARWGAGPVSRTLIARVPDVSFPDVDRVLPDAGDWRRHVTVDRAAMRVGLARLADAAKRCVQFVPEADGWAISATSDTLRAEDWIAYGGGPSGDVFEADSRYLIAALDLIGTERVDVGAAHALAPIVIVAEGDVPQTCDCVAVVMPMRIDGGAR